MDYWKWENISMSKKSKLNNLNRDIDIKEAEMKLKMMSMVESMPSFAKDPDEKQWTTLNDISHEEYNQAQVADLRLEAQALYYTSPLARGIINTLINFIIGRSFKIVPDDTDEKIIEYWDKFWEDNKMDMRSKELVKRTLRDGESFLQFFDMTQETPPLVRFIRPSQIKDKDDKYSFGIQTDPQDVETSIRYYRQFPNNEGNEENVTIEAGDMIHTKIMVDSDVKRGLSFLIGIIKYIKDYTDWLNDRKHLNKIRTIFNLIAKPTGGSSPSTFANGFTDSTIKSNSGGDQTYNKKLPKSGSIIGSKGVDYEFANLNLNAGDTAKDGRAMLLMVVAGSNLAEYMVTGDASNANYASTMVSESPAVRTFESWQDFFSHTFKDIYKKVIMDAVNEGVIPGAYEREVTEWDPIKKENTVRKETVDVTGKCTLDFPILIHRDIEKETKAFAVQDQMGYVSKQTVSNKLGYDYEEEQKKKVKEAQEEELLAYGTDDDHNHEPDPEDGEDDE